MNAPVEITKQDYRLGRIQHARWALLISLLSLVFAAWSLFETALRQPLVSVYAGPFWQYGRSGDVENEELTVPVTFANNGARAAAVLSLKLAVASGTERRRMFVASGIVTGEGRTLFAPVSITGRSAYTASIVFVPADSPLAKPVIDAAGTYTGRLTVCTTYNKSFGLFDTLLTFPPEDIVASLALPHFDIGHLVDKHTETITAKMLEDHGRSGSSCPSS
ncbi:MAG: hypothetical protein WBX25_17970 [Rhodomicrobium sp.]